MEKQVILVIDDEVQQADVVRRLLESTGRYSVLVANSAAEGLEQVRQNRQFLRHNKIRLILLDIKMPDMDGLQFLKELRQQHGDDQIGVIMLTAYEDAEKWDKATSGFVAGYLKKPVVEEELIGSADRFFSDPEAAVKMTLETFERHIEKTRQEKVTGGKS